MTDDIRNTDDHSGPMTGRGGGAIAGAGEASGGLGAGGDRALQGRAAPEADSWDAPGVTPDGRRTGSSFDGPRIAQDGEGGDNPEKWAGAQEPNDG